MGRGARGLFAAILVVVFVLAGASTALAASEGGFTYTLLTSPTRARVLGYTGTDSDIVVPTTLGGYPVTEIYANAFKSLTTATSVTLPDSVTNVGSAAFSGMTNITRINFGRGLRYLDISSVRGCSSLTIVALPATISAIQGSVFRDCTSLTAAYFLGDAPTMGTGVFLNTAPGFTVYVRSTGNGYGLVPGIWSTYPTAYYGPVSVPASSPWSLTLAGLGALALLTFGGFRNEWLRFTA